MIGHRRDNEPILTRDTMTVLLGVFLLKSGTDL